MAPGQYLFPIILSGALQILARFKFTEMHIGIRIVNAR